MEFHRVIHVATPDKPADETQHILTVSQKDPEDATPIQMISAARLAELLTIEAAARIFAAALPVQAQSD